MKKILLWLLVLTMCISMLASFSVVSCQEKVTLTYSIWDTNQLPATETIVNNFTKLHPNITVKVEVTPWGQYWMKLDTSVAAGGGADVFWINANSVPKYASVLLSLSDKIKADNVDIGKYPNVGLFNYKGEQYAIPRDFDTIGLWYNKMLFDAAGIKYPDETWDWSTLFDAAKKLTDASKGIWGFAARLVKSGHSERYCTIPQAGGFVLSEDKKTSGYDKPETIAGIKFWTNLIEAKVSPTIQQMADTDAGSLFASGKVAMLFAGSWMASEYGIHNEYTKDKVDVAVLPKGVKRAVSIGGLGNCINVNTKNPEEAWLFVKYLGGKEAAVVLAETGSVIPAFEGTQEMWVNSVPNLNLKVFIDMVANYGVPTPVTKDMDKWREVEYKYLKQAFTGEITVEDACKKIASEMNAILEKEEK